MITNNTFFDTAVLLITFNRPETTELVFEQIKSLRPSKLFIFSDAPRLNRSSEKIQVDKCRALFDKSLIDWECDFHYWFPDSNLGCAVGVSSAISWAFESVETLIILEDDCLPHPTFFTFCESMLKKYSSDQRIMHIAGTRWHEEFEINQADHFFSLIGHIWGWATWKRAWANYDFYMKGLDSMKRSNKLEKLFGQRGIAKYWYGRFDKVQAQISKYTWDYQWHYALFAYDGLAVVPNVNLISNIGPEGVHSFGTIAEHHFCKTTAWQKKQVPVEISYNLEFEIYHAERRFLKLLPIKIRILNRIKGDFEKLITLMS